MRVCFQWLKAAPGVRGTPGTVLFLVLCLMTRVAVSASMSGITPLIPIIGPPSSAAISRAAQTVASRTTPLYRALQASEPALRQSGAWNPAWLGVVDRVEKHARQITVKAALKGVSPAILERLKRDLNADIATLNRIIGTTQAVPVAVPVEQARPTPPASPDAPTPSSTEVPAPPAPSDPSTEATHPPAPLSRGTLPDPPSPSATDATDPADASGSSLNVLSAIRAISRGGGKPNAKATSGGKVRVAVLAYRADGLGYTLSASNIGLLIANTLSANLNSWGKVTLVERQDLDRITSEIRIGAGGLIEPASAAKIGQLTGAQYLIYGEVENAVADVTDAERARNSLGIGGIKVPLLGRGAKADFSKVTAKVAVHHTLTSVDTGEKLLEKQSSVVHTENVSFKDVDDAKKQEVIMLAAKDATKDFLKLVESRLALAPAPSGAVVRPPLTASPDAPAAPAESLTAKIIGVKPVGSKSYLVIDKGSRDGLVKSDAAVLRFTHTDTFTDAQGAAHPLSLPVSVQLTDKADSETACLGRLFNVSDTISLVEIGYNDADGRFMPNEKCFNAVKVGDDALLPGPVAPPSADH